jgi:hypothetical protein
MHLAARVFDIWAFRRESDAIGYLLPYASMIKPARRFNGGGFRQVPGNFVGVDEVIEDTLIRCPGLFGLTANFCKRPRRHGVILEVAP